MTIIVEVLPGAVSVLGIVSHGRMIASVTQILQDCSQLQLAASKTTNNVLSVSNLTEKL